MRVGVLALQGGFAVHAAALARLGADPVEVRRCREMESLDGLILPGGESTTLLNLMQDEPWFECIEAFHTRGGTMLGTCAGAILLSREVTGPAQPSLGLLDAAIERNGYGRQVDSFEVSIPSAPLGGTLHGVFIRAPRFRSLGAGVEVLASLNGEPVLVREGSVLAATFHPELTSDARLHRHFLEITDRRRSAVEGPRVVTAASR